MQKIMQLMWGGLALGLGGIVLVPSQTLEPSKVQRAEYWSRLDGWEEIVPKRRRKSSGSGEDADAAGYQLEQHWPLAAEAPRLKLSSSQTAVETQILHDKPSPPDPPKPSVNLADPTFFGSKNHFLLNGSIFDRHHFRRWGTGGEETFGYRAEVTYGISDRVGVYGGWSPAMAANDFTAENRLRAGLISRLADGAQKVDLYAAIDFARPQKVEDRLIDRRYGSIDLDVDGYVQGVSFLHLSYDLPDTNWFRFGLKLSQRLQRFAYAAKVELNSARRIEGRYHHLSEYYRDLGNDYYYHSKLSGDGVVQQQDYFNVKLGGLLWWQLSPQWSVEMDMSYQFNQDVKRRFLGFDAYSHTKYLFIDGETLHYQNNYQLQAALNWTRKNYLVRLRGGHERVGDLRIDDSLQQFTAHFRSPNSYRWGVGLELQAYF